MINPFFPALAIATFLICIFSLKFWIKKAKQIGLVWKDMNKLDSGEVPGSGGVIVMLAFTLGILIYTSYMTFFVNGSPHFIEIFALLMVVLLAENIGMIDDLLGWQRGGLPMKTRLILVLLASIPLVAINAGRSLVSLPFIGPTELGLVYPIIVIPLGVVGATTTFNMLAGYNGLEAGQGILLTVAFGIVSILTGNLWLGVIAFVMASALLGFLLYNFYPARIFPGDSLTYSVGGLLAALAILGNFERIAVFFFVPYIIETVLKLRGGLKKQSFAKPGDKGLEMKYDKIYSLNHLSIWVFKKLKIKPTERGCVYLIWAFQGIIILAGFLIFRRGIFV